MRRLLKRSVARCGREAAMIFADGTQQTVRAIIQPVRSNSRGAMERDAAGAGLSGPEQYVYIGPAAAPLADAAYLTADGVEYLVRRAERLYLGDEAIYVWGLLVRSGGAAAWNS